MEFIVPISYFENFGQSQLIKLNLSTGEINILLEYTPPKKLITDRKGITRIDYHIKRKLFFISDYNSVLLIDPSDWEIIAIWHSPDMNDLHDIKIYNNKVYIVNTGNESIDIYSDNGKFIGSHSFHSHWINKKRLEGLHIKEEALEHNKNILWPSDFIEMKSERVDNYYDHPDSTLPFYQKKVKDCYHLNHISLVNNKQLLVTMFMQKQIIDLFTWDVVISNLPSHPHDGFVHKNEFWITCVNGDIYSYAIVDGKVTNQLLYHYDIFAITGHTGWCRGLWVTENYLFIGLTQIQEGKMSESRWSGYPVNKTETSILWFDRKKESLLSYIDLTDKRGSKIFGFYPL